MQKKNLHALMHTSTHKRSYCANFLVQQAAHRGAEKRGNMEDRRKITIADVARAAGVSNSAVSYALNGRPGVSPETRDKILQTAQNLGWQPNRAAQSLSAAKSRSIGLILDGDPSLAAVEPYFMRLIAGVTQECEKNNYSLVLRRASTAQAEVPVIEQWIASGAVDGMILTNVEAHDARFSVLADHPDFPVVALADPSMVPHLPTLSSDDVQACSMMLEHLTQLGHKSIAHISGPENLAHTQIREKALKNMCEQQGIQYTSIATDYTSEGGTAATLELLTRYERPTAIIYGNDVMALAGLVALRKNGFSIPRDMSLVSWDDSVLCSTVSPALTSMYRDVVNAGERVTQMLLALIDGHEAPSQKEKPYTLMVRSSTVAPHAL